MALESENVRVAITGAVYVGAIDATLPTDESSAVTGFDDLGFISDDGLEESIDRSTEAINAWQKGAKVREVITEASFTLTFTMIETKAETLALYYGVELPTVTGGKAKIYIDPSSTGGRKRMVIDVIDGDRIERTVLPSCEVTEVEARSLTSSEAIGYGVTVQAYAVSDETNGTYSAIKYFAGLEASEAA